jgi:hypothetical protein
MSSAITPMIQSMIPTNPTSNTNTMLADVMAASPFINGPGTIRPDYS